MISLNNIQIRTIWTSGASELSPLKSYLPVEKWGAKRAGVRFGGNSNNQNCSSRNLNSNNLVSNTNTNYAGSAKVLKFLIPDMLHQSQERRNYKTSPLCLFVDEINQGGREWVSISNLN